MAKLTAHDVRKLRVCILCKELGIYRPNKPLIDIPTVVNVQKTGGTQFCHPICYYNEMGRAALCALPDAELNYIRLSDVGVKIMSAIVKKQVPRIASIEE